MAKVKACKVEDFFRFTPEELHKDLKTGHYVQFSDGVLYLNPHEITINRFIHDIFYGLENTRFVEEYGRMPILTDYSITKYYVNGFFASKSLSGLIERIFKDVCLFYVEPKLDRSILDEFLFDKIQAIYNDIYNIVVCNGTEYMNSIDILDFYEIQFQPKLIEAVKDIAKSSSEEDIVKCYKVLDDVLRNTPELRSNPIVRGYLSGAFNPGQVLQILASRGYTTEINSDIIPSPVLSSFFLGMEDIASFAAETRNSAKAQYVSHRAIEQSEYLARMLQLVTMRIERLVDGDCGSTDYYEYYLNPDPIIGKDELPLFVGKWYLDEETGTEKVITKDDKHLIGKIIKLRSPVTCKHSHSACVCLKCMGQLGYSIPYPTNIGHALAVEVTQKITQSLLSTKHHTGSAVSIDFTLGPVESEFFSKHGKDGIRLKKNFHKNKTYDLIVKQECFKGLSSLISTMNFDIISANKNSKLEKFYIRVTDNKTGIASYHECNIAFTKSGSKNNKVTNKTSASSIVNGYFTNEFLKYIVGVGYDSKNYELDPSGDSYVINLNKWDEKCNVIEFPTLEYNYFQLTKEVKQVVRNIASEDGTVEKLIQNLFDLLNIKLDIPFAIIEILAIAFTVRDMKTGDVRIARGKSNQVTKLSNILNNGSLGGLCAYERHNDKLLIPKTMSNHNKGIHPLDVALCPEQVVSEHERGLR